MGAQGGVTAYRFATYLSIYYFFRKENNMEDLYLKIGAQKEFWDDEKV